MASGLTGTDEPDRRDLYPRLTGFAWSGPLPSQGNECGVYFA
jgi:hypothetical protein